MDATNRRFLSAQQPKPVASCGDILDRALGYATASETAPYTHIDTTTAGGRLVFHVFGALAEFERSLIRERTGAGLAAARARGRIGGRPAALSEADKAVAAALMKEPNITMTQIAGRLGCAVSTLHRHFPGGRKLSRA